MKLFFFFNVFLCFASCLAKSRTYKASYIDTGKECVILSPDKCPPCDCDKKPQHITFNPKSWFNAFVNSMKGGCVCDDCRKAKTVRCKNGVCDLKNQKCVCAHCWEGEVCDKFKNKYLPSFKRQELHISIPKAHPQHLPVTTVSATDKDKELCNGGNCPCGDIVYKLNNNKETFTMNEGTGAVFFKKTPKLRKYVLKISAVNIQDGEATGGDNAEVHIIISNNAGNEGNINKHRNRRDINDNDDEDEVEDEVGAIGPHLRVRRSSSSALSNVLVISAKPLGNKYYFNKKDKVNFTVTAEYNGTGATISNLLVGVTSSALKIDRVDKGAFASATVAGSLEGSFSITSLAPGNKITGEVWTTVKDTIGPLENLNLDLAATADGGVEKTAKSSPIVYGVYPKVNLTGQAASVETYGDLDIQMTMQLPLLNYHLIVELTTNVECFVFMEVKDVSVSIGQAITNTYSAPVRHTSENSHGLVDRVVMDFGNITVADTGDKVITIDYKIGVKDHENVANGSTHYAGAGLQAGPSVLWVEQQNITITKIEPALEVVYNKSAIDNSTDLFIGDQIEIEYTVDHSSTSEDDAKNVKIYLSSPSGNMELKDTTPADILNSTYLEYGTAIATLAKGQEVSSKFIVVVKDTITPLISIPLQLIAVYENSDGVKKFPVTKDVTLPLVGTPSFQFNRTGGSGDITFGTRLTYELTIQLVKTRSPLRVEIVLPKTENLNTTDAKIINQTGTPLMTILSLDSTVGSNIVDDAGRPYTVTSQPKLYTTTDNGRWKDQAVWNLTTAKNRGTDTSNSPDNQIKIKVEALVLEATNLPSGETVKIGAGVIGLPRMVWIGQLDATIVVNSGDKPRINFTYFITDETKDEYQYHVHLNHSLASTQYAHNLTFEYYLPPYVKFVEVVSSSPSIKKVGSNPQRARFRIKGAFTFLDTAEHIIKVRLDKSLAPESGSYSFDTPLGMFYTNYLHKKFQFFKTVSREIQVLSNAPFIERKKDANPSYYGRGIYVNPNDVGDIHVCMNMHLPSATPACYKSTDAGTTWRAHDSRVGSIVGKDSSNNLYAIGRNQIVVIKYDEGDDDWYLLSEREKAKMKPFFDNRQFKDFSGVTIMGPEKITDSADNMHNNQRWGATDEWLFYRPSSSGKDWVKKAKWRLQ